MQGMRERLKKDSKIDTFFCITKFHAKFYAKFYKKFRTKLMLEDNVQN